MMCQVRTTKWNNFQVEFKPVSNWWFPLQGDRKKLFFIVIAKSSVFYFPLSPLGERVNRTLLLATAVTAANILGSLPFKRKTDQ
jgi:hypothetical protein